ncbi:hypothetical protein HN604_00765 [archaeon]|jgi:hypothetical protein|nr:hypothetical protein [archaeon]MBT6182396.1 hypothetical protein [archaeon]MBT6606446.1 hypothetical protein [archaeon]MBT7251703.1 hypothetical protein [archaeon]MBT7660596.1 hypothetical protein [archaeon]
MKKKGAIEMSIGTIVIIVLSMSMLILGLVLVKNIFGGATDLVDLNNQQIAAEIANVYGDDQKVVLYPNVNIFDVKPGKSSAFAIRIKNTIEGTAGQNALFSYEISLEGLEECELSQGDVFSWMIGESGDNIAIPSSEGHIEKILINVPEGAPLCEFKTRVNVLNKVDGTEKNYGAAQFFIKIK